MNLKRLNPQGCFRIYRWLFALCLVCMAWQPAKAQERLVALPALQISIRDALREIESQTGYLFAIGHSNFDMTKTVKLAHARGSVRDILNTLLDGSGREYRVDGDQILLIPVQLDPEEQKTMVIKRFDWSLSYSDDQFHEDARADSLRRVALEALRRNELVTPEVEMTILVDSVFRFPSSTFTWGDLKAREWKKPSYLQSNNHILIKTNLLHNVAAKAITLSGETGIDRQTSLDLSWGYNGWNRNGSADDNKKLIHWYLRPEFRWWACDRFEGHFFGAHAFYWQYNVSQHRIPLLFEKENQYEGNAFGVGISYGYHWAWNRRWGMEFNVGVGVAFMNYDKYDCVKCGDKLGNFDKTYIGPTSLGIKLVYLIK